MTTPQENSPNWHWLQLGYTIVRQGAHRTIKRPDGSVVDTGDGSHEDEMKAELREVGK